MNTVTIEESIDCIRAGGIVAIVRGDFRTDFLVEVARALRGAGVTAMEVTLNSPRSAEHIRALVSAVGGEMLIGAGTVRTAGQVDAALKAGARFLVSPGFDAGSVARSRQAGVLHLPGVFTPTEAQLAAAAGCRMLKLFPADALGPSYLKALRAPLDDVDFVPTGGVTEENIAAWRLAGAVAVATGSTLVSGGLPLDEIERRARAMRQAWEECDHG